MTKLFVTFEIERVSDDLTSQEQQRLARPIFSQICDRLRAEGYRPHSSPQEWDDYGWYIEFEVDGATIVVMLQRSDEWMLQIWAERGLMDRLKGRHYETQIQAFSKFVSELVRSTFDPDASRPMTEDEFRAAS